MSGDPDSGFTAALVVGVILAIIVIVIFANAMKH